MKEDSCDCGEKLDKETSREMRRYGHHGHHHGNGSVYGLGFIGAAIFFVGKATTFWMGVVGFLKAMVWPAYLTYEALKFLIK